VSCARETAEFLDVDMEEASGLFVLVTPCRLGRVEVLEPGQTCAFEDAADGWSYAQKLVTALVRRQFEVA
jgi:hypothetical protein